MFRYDTFDRPIVDYEIDLKTNVERNRQTTFVRLSKKNYSFRNLNVYYKFTRDSKLNL